MYNLYFLKSLKNGKIYAGTTEKDPKERLMEHNSGTNQWSRNNRPLVLLYYESYCCKQDLLHREKFYKQGFGRMIRNQIIKAVSAIG